MVLWWVRLPLRLSLIHSNIQTCDESHQVYNKKVMCEALGLSIQYNSGFYKL